MLTSLHVQLVALNKIHVSCNLALTPGCQDGYVVHLEIRISVCVLFVGSVSLFLHSLMGCLYSAKHKLLRQKQRRKTSHIPARNSPRKHVLFCSIALIIQRVHAEEDCHLSVITIFVLKEFRTTFSGLR